jgi:predicted RNA-binding Zn ribbon-like protein
MDTGDEGRHSVAAQNAGDGQGAPGRLEVLREFVNTRDLEDGIEELSDPGATQAWLRRHGLPQAPAASPADVERLRDLREALRELLLANNGESHDGQGLGRLRAEAAAVGLRVRFAGNGESALVPAGEGADAVVAELLAITHESMAAGTWPRLKACRAHDCEWAFYDRSRNRSGTWCSMAVCGNRAKARNYRRRHGAAEAR